MTITAPHNTTPELLNEQTIDHPYNPNMIKGILEYKIKNFSKLRDNRQFKNTPEFDTEYNDVKENLNLEVSDVVKTFHTSKNDNYYLKTQKWLGHIIEVVDQTIFTKLEDFNNPTTYEIAEFDLEDIPYEDRELIKVGAGFYFSVGQSYDKNGQVEKKSLIRFQRTNPWDESGLQTIIAEADNLYQKLKWD